MKDRIHRIELAMEFRTCPLCGYADGFHSMLQRQEETVKLLLICPACSEIFDLGQTLH